MVDAILDALAKEDLSSRLDAVQKFDSAEITPESLPDLFSKFSECMMREVRQAAAQRIALCPSAFETYLHDLDPQVQIIVIGKSLAIRPSHPDPALVLSLLTDQLFIRNSPTEVRYAVARVLARHAALDPDRALVVQKIIPVIDLLIRDGQDDVRVATASNVKELAKEFGLEFIFEHCHATLHLMLTDSQWRLRSNAVEILFGLAIVSTQEFFDEQLFQLLLGFLRDPCDRVRQFTLTGLPNLVERFGPEWLQTKLVRNLQELALSPNFLHRQAYLLAISSLVNYFPEQYRSNFVFQPMIRLLKDEVNNVVAVALILLSEQLDAIHPFRRQYELRPILEALAADAPPTVRDIARAFINQFHSTDSRQPLPRH
jgi:HEAT repeat protein